jgi:type IV pilus assembly protein PilY1
MRRLYIVFFALTLLYMKLHPYPTDAAVMEDYCVVPPYIIQNVAPNVMIVLDNSGSMLNFAYFDGFNTTATGDDNSCANSGSPCTGFADPGVYPTYKYYGYFNPDYWYTYSSNRFIYTAPKTGSGLTGARAMNAGEWDGNFLNWLTMRRVDVIRKVMTGGREVR